MPSMNPQKFFDVATVLVVFLLSASILFAQQNNSTGSLDTPDSATQIVPESNGAAVDSHSNTTGPVDESVLVTATSVLDHGIVDPSGSEFGSVTDIVVSSDGKMAFLVVHSGDILGLGGKEFAVPFNSIKVVTNLKEKSENCLQVNKNSESLSKANTLAAVDRLELRDEQWVKRNNQFFGSNMPFSDKPQISIKSVIEKDVTSIDGEVAGNLHDLLMRFDDKKLEFAIVQHGGVLGVGETYVALPFDNLIFSQDRDLNWLMSTKLDVRAIQSRQQVTPNEYPELKLKSIRNQINTSPTGPSVDLPSKQEQSPAPNADVSSS